MTKIKLLVLCLIVLFPTVSESQYVLQPAFPNLPLFAAITELANANDNRLFLTQLNGIIYVMNNTPSVSTRKIFLDIRNKVAQSGVYGLHGIAFHPDYSINRYFYLHYAFDSAGSPTGKWLRVSRFQTSLNPDSALYNSEVTLIRVPLPNTEHNGGKLAFGNDGYLYISFGDGDTPGIISQDRTEFLGKLLRINIDVSSGGKNYSIPPTNVYYQNTQGFKEEIYAYGFRNPWKFSFDYPTNQLWLADVGDKWFEEINLVENGKNYGWNKMEGFHCYPDSNICDTTGKGFARPIHEYKHRVGAQWEATASVTGGYVYRGSLLPELYGKYIFGDFIEGKVWSLNYNGTVPAVSNQLLDTTFYIATFGVDNNNEIYVCRYGGSTGTIFKLRAVNDAGITGVTYNPSGIVYSGTSVCFDTEVKNFGAANLSTVPVKYSVNDGPVIGFTNTGILNSGNSTFLSFCGSQSYTFTNSGNFKFKFFTSLSNDVSNYNDTATIIVNVIDSSRDVGITAITSIPTDTIYTGTNVCFNTKLINYGMANLSNVQVKYNINGGWPVGPVNTGSLFSGDSNVVLFCNDHSFTPASAGSYTLKFFTLLSGDTNYSNDTAILVLNVIDSSRDAGVSAVTSIPSDTIYTGMNVCFDAEVRNYGLANLSEVPVSYIVNDGDVIGPISSGAFDLDRAATATFCNEHSFTPASAGSYTLKFFTLLNGDTNYSNDTAILVLNVIDSSRDAGVSAVTSIPSDTIYTGMSVCFNAEVRNYGLANLSEVPVSYTINNTDLKGPIVCGEFDLDRAASALFCDEHSFTPAAAGSYTLKFFTLLNGDTNYSNDTAIFVLNVIDSSRDAGVSAVTSIPSDTIYTGMNVCFDAEVRNYGLANLSEVPVSYTINNTDLKGPIVCGEFDLNRSATATFCNEHSFTPAAAGSYTLKFFTLLNGDTNYSNDTSILVLNVIDSSRDAGVSAVTSIPSDTIYTGMNVCFNTEVRNYGLANLSEVPVSYTINNTDLKGPIVCGEFDLDRAATATFCNEHSFTPAAAGSYTLKFFTLLNGDTNYSNDTAILVLNVIDSSRDAGVSAVTSIPSDTIYTGMNVCFNAEVRNYGLANLSEVQVSYILNDGDVIGPIASGEFDLDRASSALFCDEHSFTPAAAGSYTLKFFTSLSGDTNYSNDTAIFVLNVIDSSRDAGVSAVTSIPSDTIYTGMSVCFNAEVRNYGLANLSEVPVSYIVNDGDVIGPIASGEFDLDRAASALFCDEHSFTPASAGSYTLKFFTLLNGDTNYSNDTAILVLNVIDSSRDAGVSAVTSIPSDTIYTGMNVCFNAEVRNYGLANLSEVPVSYSVNDGDAIGPIASGVFDLDRAATALFCDEHSFTPAAAGSYTLKFFTLLNGDTNYSNDTAIFVLNVIDSSRDAGVSAVTSIPSDTIYTGMNVCFDAEVRNYGLANLSEVPVSYSVNDGDVIGPIASGEFDLDRAATALFCDEHSFTPSSAGSYTLKFFTLLNGDTNYSNDTAILVLNVIDSSRDAGVSAVTSIPSDTIYTGMNVCFNAEVRNYGLANLSEVPVSYTINNTDLKGPIVCGEFDLDRAASALFCDEHSFTPAVAGSYTLKFFTLLNGDTNYSNDTTILVLNVIDSSRDAGVSAVTNIPSDTIYTGMNVCFDAEVRNYGLANLSEVPVSYSVNDGDVIGPIASGEFDLDRASSVLFCDEHSFTPASAGSYTLKFFTSLIGDTNYSNDTAIFVLNVIDSSRDAGVSAVTSIPSDTIYTGMSVCFNAEVRNYGLANLSEVPVSYTINNTDLKGPIVCGEFDLNRSATATFCNEHSFTPSSAGSYTLKFFTLLNGDTNYSNDTAIFVLNVIDSSRDAGVSAVTSIPSDTIYTGMNVCFDAEVRNYGLANLSNVQVKYNINGGWPVGPVNTGSLFSGDSNVVLFCDEHSFIPSSAGSYTLKFFTLLNGDTNYSNDTAILVLNVIDSSRDAGVSAVTSIPSDTIYTGMNVCFDAEVRNYGLANLSEVPVSYTVNDGDAIGPIASGSFDLDRSATATFCNEHSFTPSSAGSYTLKFFTLLNGDTNYSNDTAILVLNVIDSIPDVTNISSVTITVSPQGLYEPSTSALNLRDTVTVLLRNCTFPYDIADTSRAVIDSVTMTGIFQFIHATSGTYYIVVKHRNSLETWSKQYGEPLNAEPCFYDFTCESSQAYNSNMKLKGNKYCIYSGDINQDGEIDAADISLVDNQVFNFQTGYLNEDCTGDNVVDLLDLAIVDDNSFNYVGTIKP